MFKSPSGFTNSFFGSFAYNPIIARHQNHVLVRMDNLIDWSFVEEEVADCYSTAGQHAYHPVPLLKPQMGRRQMVKFSFPLWIKNGNTRAKTSSDNRAATKGM